VVRRAPSPCTNPTCPNLTPDGGRCALCRAEAVAEYNRTYHTTPQARARKAIYNSRRWRGLRRTVLRARPWCEASDCPNLATDVDHIVPLRVILANQGDPFDPTNVQPLCKRHHAEKTAREVFGRK
jgi:5-methylcytosine-specific restriction enzyme A